MAEVNKDTERKPHSESSALSSTSRTGARQPELYRTRESLARATSPFSLMQRFMNDMDRWFGDFGTSSNLPSFIPSGVAQNLWAPQIDVFERDQELIVHADLPGLRQEDVKVNVDQGLLTISGQRSFEQENERDKGNVYHRERSFGAFQRSIALPDGVGTAQIRASFDNGVLEVRVPIPDQPQQTGREIPIGPKMSAGAAKH
jgi:HSP20 family protein